MGFAFNDSNVIVLPGKEELQGGRIHERHDPFRIIAHSVQFEYAIYHFILHKRYGWPELLDPKRWDCTMARALMCGLPASLEGCALALKVPFQKDMDGKRAMYETCKPQKDGTWCEDPEVLERLYRYNRIDVETERSLDKALRELPESERKIFELDLVMNRRGVAIDIESVKSAAAIAESETDRLNEELRKLTKGAVSKASRVAEMKRWIAAQGVKIPMKLAKPGPEAKDDKETLDKEAIIEILGRTETPKIVKDVVTIRQQVGKSSVAKFSAMLSASCADGRVRGALQYHGAHTGRWAGRIIQPQNYPQGFGHEDQECALALLQEPGLFASVYNGVGMQTLSNILRGMLIAGEGKSFIGADYNAIEARIVFWLANEIGALSMYSRRESPYLDMGRLIFGREITKKDAMEYALAKMTVLGCGFGMGWKKFQGQALARGVDISDELAQKAIKTYRDYYRNVVKMWYDTQGAAIRAVLNPKTSQPAADGKVFWMMSRDRRFLGCCLPSGRWLRYFRPEVKIEDSPHGEQQVLYYWTAADAGALKTECNGMLGQYKTWGGELVENVVQAIARDIMVQGMLKAEAAGYPLIITVHDELLAEIGSTREPQVDLKNFCNLMCQTPAWAKGLPVAAEGWIGKRYRK